MQPLLYSELVPWYRLLDPLADHLEEADAFQAAFERVVTPKPTTLLELGAGAGHNAFHMKRHARCTLVDLSEDMLSLSRELNPECEHAVHDRHVEGLFARATWNRLFATAGYLVEPLERPLGDGEVDEVFLCRRP